LDENQGGGLVPRKAPDGADLSASEGEELQRRPSRRLLWPRTVPSTSPTSIESPQNTAASDRFSLEGLPENVRHSGPETEDDVEHVTEDETTSRDAVSSGKTHTTMHSMHSMRSLGPRGYQRPSYQLISDGVPKDLQLLERIPSASTKPKAPNARQSLFKPGAMLNISPRKAALQKSRLIAVEGAASTEQGLIIDTTIENKARSSKKTNYSQGPRPVVSNQRSPTLAPRSSSQGLASELEPNRADSTRSSLYSPINVSQPPTQGEDSQSTGGTNKVVTLSENHHDRLMDRRIAGSGRSTNLWILRSNHPRKAWVLWPRAELIKENLPSIFAAVAKYTEIRDCLFLEIMLQTPEQSFTFQTSRDDVQHFEDMKQFMSSIIEASSAEMPDSKMLIGIWITPIEPSEG
jgi:hypothetical protein